MILNTQKQNDVILALEEENENCVKTVIHV